MNNTVLFAPKASKVALEGARALETGFDWDEEPHGAGSWGQVQDLLYGLAGTTFEDELKAGVYDKPEAPTLAWRPKRAEGLCKSRTEVGGRTTAKPAPSCKIVPSSP